MKYIRFVFLSFFIISSSQSYAMEEIIKLLKIKNVFSINDFLKITELTKKEFKVIPFLTLKRSFISRDKTPNDIVDKFLREQSSWDQVIYFQNLSDLELNSSNIDAIRFIRAKKAFESGEYKKSIQEIRSMDKNGKIYYRSLYLLGLMFVFNNQYSAARDAFKGCVRNFEKLIDSDKKEQSEIAQFIIDKCQIAISRVYFKEQKFDDAIESYKKIPIESYEWPESLLELSWVYYVRKEYPRSFARNLTLENKSFSKFMLAENRLLAVLNLKQNCHLKQALDLVTKSADEYNNLLEQLKNYNSLDDTSRWKLLENDKVNTPYISQRKKILKNIEYDLKKLKKEPNTIVRNTFETELEKMEIRIREEMNAFVKKHLKRKYQSISRNIEDLIAVKLSIINEIKIEEKKDAKKVIDPNLGKDKVRWKFNNEYWPDELKDVSVNLVNRCT